MPPEDTVALYLAGSYDFSQKRSWIFDQQFARVSLIFYSKWLDIKLSTIETQDWDWTYKLKSNIFASCHTDIE